MATKIVNNLKHCITKQDIHEYKTIMTEIKSLNIGCLGGRKFGITNKGTLTANQLTKFTDQLISSLALSKKLLSTDEQEDLKEIINCHKTLEIDGNANLAKANGFQKKLTWIKQLFGNLFFNRKSVLVNIEDKILHQLPYKLFKKTEDELKQEWKNLPASGRKDLCSFAKTQKRNRYNDVLPYDDNRFKTKNDLNFYYNASVILDSKAIAAQAPTDDPIDKMSFWRMVMDSGSSEVVMLTEISERMTLKSSLYWPNMKTMINHGILCTTLSEKKDWLTIKGKLGPGIVEREIELNDNNHKKVIKHYQLVGWSDHGVVEPDVLIKLIKKVKEPKSSEPVIVHCSAGLGRSGVFLAVLDLYHTHILKGKPINKDTLFQKVSEMRKPPQGRSGMITTAEQYVLAYRCLEKLSEK